MPRAIEQLRRSGLTVGHAGLGIRGTSNVPGSPAQQVHDGDTAVVNPLGNLGVRFLGVDAAEESFTLPGGDTFVPIDDSQGRWEAFLSDPFDAQYGPIDPPLDAATKAYLAQRVGPGTALNHARHSEAARHALRKAVEDDMVALGKTKENFEFFIAFANEIMDGYGRLLGYLNRDQPANGTPRPLSYNERLLEAGLVTPYFIWPNTEPFRRAAAVSKAVPPPTTQATLADKGSLGRARKWVSDARQNEIGIFDAADPLRLYPFELRFLARREPPTRWLIDLSASDDRLIPPQEYHTVANAEDRLWIPDEYLPLWVEHGWKRG
ncbi:MAG TPA: hypothetical protein VFZ89_10925 [Solirubrobacteraceae bacterium]